MRGCGGLKLSRQSREKAAAGPTGSTRTAILSLNLNTKENKRFHADNNRFHADSNPYLIFLMILLIMVRSGNQNAAHML
jgi:hypothetical protein